VTPNRQPRYRVTIHELHDGKTTKAIDTYGSAFITATATHDGDLMDIHFGKGGTGTLRQHTIDAIAHEYSPRRRR
jgi:hypothetical protein